MTTTTTTITNYFNVSEQQIEACTRIEQSGKVHYSVTSQTTVGTDYTVAWNTAHRVLQCSCKAGSEGMNCWHKRAALAANKFYQAEKQGELEATRPVKETAEQAQIEAWVRQGHSRAEAERVTYAKPAKTSTVKGNLNGDRAFNLYR